MYLTLVVSLSKGNKMYLVIDPYQQLTLGDSPEEAVKNYRIELDDYAVESLKIYQLTNLKAKGNTTITISAEPVGKLPPAPAGAVGT